MLQIVLVLWRSDLVGDHASPFHSDERLGLFDADSGSLNRVLHQRSWKEVQEMSKID